MIFQLIIPADVIFYFGDTLNNLEIQLAFLILADSFLNLNCMFYSKGKIVKDRVKIVKNHF